MTVLLYCAGGDLRLLLIDPRPGEEVCQAVNCGQWSPLPEWTKTTPPAQLRALRLSKEVVLVFALAGDSAIWNTQPLAGLLSPRQTAVLHLLTQGRTTKQIAVELGLSRRTVFLHLAAIRQRLGVFSNTQAVLRAAQLGLWGKED
ncbi:MAG: LuxR C-terminal-related transcriptional regulator [Chloroflexota bacterium]